MEYILAFIAGVAISAVAAYFMFRGLISKTEQRERQRYDDMLKVQTEAQNKAMADLDRLHKQALDNMKEQLKNETAEILKKRQSEFQDTNSKSMGDIVNPLKKEIEDMKQALKDNSVAQTNTASTIKGKIDSLVSTTLTVSQSADRLSNALTKESKIQGNWGESKLENLLNAMGLQKGLEYDTQEYLRDKKGQKIKNEDSDKNMQPDVILYLDKERALIVDSKVSLTAFVDYTNSEDESSRAEALKAHLDSVRKHVDELAKKEYAKYIEAPRKSVDFVMMFVPIEPALQLALSADPNLWRYAMEKGVFIVGEQNLYAAMRAVQVSWTAIKQEESHQEIFKKAALLVDRIGDFLERFESVGEKIKAAQNAYDDVVNKVDNSQGVRTTAQALISMGVQNTGKHRIKMPENVLNE